MRDRQRHRIAARLGALLACYAALFACFIAWLVHVNGREGAPHVSSNLDPQLILALAGLLPAALLVYATAFWRLKLALAALTTGIAVYAAWGLLQYHG